MSDLKIGVQMYTLRDYTKTPENIESTLKRVKELGFDVVQLSALGPIEPQRLADIVNSLELDVCITHSPLDRIINDTDALIAEHRAFGCDAIGIGMMPDPYGSSLEGARAFIRDTAEARKKMAAEGIHFGYHNHNFEFQKHDGKNIMDVLFEEGGENMGFILDTYWIQAGGGDPASFVRRAKGRMKVCHFKDMDMDGWKQIFAPVGEGNIDFMPVIAALKETGVEYVVIEQDTCKTDPFDCLALSKRNIEQMLKNA